MTFRSISAALLTASALTASPVFAADAMMAGDAMMGDDMMMANDMSGMGDAMMSGGKTIQITVENLLTGQPFSPSFFEARTTDSSPIFELDQPASAALAAVAEGGNIGMFSVGAAMNKESKPWRCLARHPHAAGPDPRRHHPCRRNSSADRRRLDAGQYQ